MHLGLLSRSLNGLYCGSSAEVSMVMPEKYKLRSMYAPNIADIEEEYWECHFEYNLAKKAHFAEPVIVLIQTWPESNKSLWYLHPSAHISFKKLKNSMKDMQRFQIMSVNNIGP